MGLFLGPFSGHAVGGGGHGVIDPPPPGTDPGSGPRSEVDTVNRTPVRLLRTTMRKHQPKFMKIVPPGQQRGTLAPPYAWDPLERDDWRFNMPKPRKLGEARHSTEVLPPQPPRPMSGPGSVRPPRRGDTRRLPRPTAPDPRKARVDAIHAELQKLKQEVQQLMARQHELHQQNVPSPKGPATPPPATHFQGVQGGGSVVTPGEAAIDFEPITDPEAVKAKARRRRLPGYARPMPGTEGPQHRPEHTPHQKRGFARVLGSLASRGLESIERSALRLLGETDGVPRGLIPDPGEKQVRAEPADPSTWKVPDTLKARRHRQSRANLDLPTGQKPSGDPQRSRAQGAEYLNIRNQLKQKRARIDQLTQELRQLRQQMKTATESTGLTSNNLRRLSLLLK